MPNSFFARLTPSQAAALKDLSSFPPMSKTIPTRSLPPDSSRLPRTLVQAGNVIAAAKINNSRFRLIILAPETRNQTPNSFDCTSSKPASTVRAEARSPCASRSRSLSPLQPTHLLSPLLSPELSLQTTGSFDRSAPLSAESSQYSLPPLD